MFARIRWASGLLGAIVRARWASSSAVDALPSMSWLVANPSMPARSRSSFSKAREKRRLARVCSPRNAAPLARSKSELARSSPKIAGCRSVTLGEHSRDVGPDGCFDAGCDTCCPQKVAQYSGAHSYESTGVLNSLLNMKDYVGVRTRGGEATCTSQSLELVFRQETDDFPIMPRLPRR
jgi:hypothetical protein